MSIAEEIAKGLLEIGAVKLKPSEPFTWASGWQSPIYCDNRVSLSFPVFRERITELLAAKVKEQYPNAEVIIGVATAGIPQAALVAKELGLPMAYVRSKAKGHGMGNKIEGAVSTGQQAVVIEDLVSTGGSSMLAVTSLRDAGINVMGLISIFTYGFQTSIDLFDKEQVAYTSLSDYGALIETAMQTGAVSSDQLESLAKWREAPDTWSPTV
jgi:orotate phosphoribosyltransferase